jgi:hypothetical protein
VSVVLFVKLASKLSATKRATTITTSVRFFASRPRCVRLVAHTNYAAFTLHSRRAPVPKRSCLLFRTFATSTPCYSALDALTDLAIAHQEKTKAHDPAKPRIRTRLIYCDRERAQEDHYGTKDYTRARSVPISSQPAQQPIPEPPELESIQTKASTGSSKATWSRNMSCSIEIVTTPTADTPGTTLVLRRRPSTMSSAIWQRVLNGQWYSRAHVC